MENNSQNVLFVFASHNTSSKTVMLKGGSGGGLPEVGLKVAITGQVPNESLPSYFFRTATLLHVSCAVSSPSDDVSS